MQQNSFDLYEKVLEANGTITLRCTLCLNKFSSQSSFSRHFKRHSGSKKQLCTHCTSSFFQRSNLLRHLKTHSSEKQFNCSICYKKFSQHRYLLVHLRSYTHANEFKCSFCQALFKHKSNLSRHEKQHIESKPFFCSLCCKRFVRKAHLTQHFSCHTTKKAFACIICLKRFSRKSNLSRHSRNFHWLLENKTITRQVKSLPKEPLPWQTLLVKLGKIRPENGQDTWPKSPSISWETCPGLIRTLRKKRLIPGDFVKFGTHWEPCYLNGRVAEAYREIGLTIRHKKEDFWLVWKKVLTPNTFIITNPPFGKPATYWLKAFLLFVVTFDRPFLLILPHHIFDRKYFQDAIDQIARTSELHIWGHSKGFYMKKVNKLKPTRFTGLTIVAYYPKVWKFTLNLSEFDSIIHKIHLHFR